MKHLYRKITLLMIVAMLGSSCAKDYLDTEPTSSTGSSTIFETADNVRIAVNGLYKCMTQQYSAFGQGYNGEGTIKYYIANFGGNDFNLSGSGNRASMNQTYHDDNRSTFILYPWYYYYRIISNANSIILYTKDAVGSEDQKEHYIAQAKVMRAYCYLMLSQLFHYRWSDGKTTEAKNGNGLVLRLIPDESEMGLSSAEDTYKQIYKDLDEAVAVLEKKHITRDKMKLNYEIDINVAYAVYARAAITKQDYPTALAYAKKAYDGYPLMDTKAYQEGFYTPTSEWIWSSYGGDTETLHYYSYFAYLAYNANTSQVRRYPRCISKELFDRVEKTDIRRSLFLDPKNMAYSNVNGQAKKGTPLYKEAFKLWPDLTSTAAVAAYMQFKVKCADKVGIGNLNHFRSSEMYLIEAEAYYFLNDEESARKALIALVKTSKRDPEYTCTATGAELLKEIKLQRRIELWGEGFEFFDIKRYGDIISRKSFKEGGNWGSTYAVTIKPTDYNNLTNVLPIKETDYNPEAK